MLFTKQMLVLFDLMSSGSVLVMRSVRLFVICCVDYDGNCHWGCEERSEDIENFVWSW